MPSVTELDTWTCFHCGKQGRYDDSRATFTLTRVDEHGNERTLFPSEREEVRLQRTAGRSLRQPSPLGYGVGVICGDCQLSPAKAGTSKGA